MLRAILAKVDDSHTIFRPCCILVCVLASQHADNRCLIQNERLDAWNDGQGHLLQYLRVLQAEHCLMSQSSPAIFWQTAQDSSEDSIR